MTVQRVKNKYKQYASGEFKLITSICSYQHFFVILLEFNGDIDGFFLKVNIYDSLRKGGKRFLKKLKTGDEDLSVNPNSVPGMFLMKLQKFFAHFVFCGSENVDTLHNDDKFILRKAIQCDCPNQLNSVDCSLFGFIVTMHLHYNLKIEADTFSQEEVTEFRVALHDLLETNKGNARKGISKDYVCSFFSSMRHLVINFDDPYLIHHTNSMEKKKKKGYPIMNNQQKILKIMQQVEKREKIKMMMI